VWGFKPPETVWYVKKRGWGAVTRARAKGMPMGLSWKGKMLKKGIPLNSWFVEY